MFRIIDFSKMLKDIEVKMKDDFRDLVDSSSVCIGEKEYDVFYFEFGEDKIEIIIDEYGNSWVSVENICSIFKIDLYEQIKILMDESELDCDVFVSRVIYPDGQKNDLFMLHPDSLIIWLNSIRFNDIGFESRKKLIRYRKFLIGALKDFADQKYIELKDGLSIIPVVEKRVIRRESSNLGDESDVPIDTKNVVRKKKWDRHRNVIDIDFCDSKIKVLKYNNGIIWVDIKGVCKAIGISEKHQMECLSTRPWMINRRISFWDDDTGQLYKRYMIHIDYFKAWIRNIKKTCRLSRNLTMNKISKSNCSVFVAKVNRMFSEVENKNEIKENIGESENIKINDTPKLEDKKIPETIDSACILGDEISDNENDYINPDVWPKLMDLMDELPPFEEELDDENDKVKEDEGEEMVKNTSNFEKHVIYTFIYKGKPCWIAKDIGNILGYSRSGSVLVNIMRAWEKAGELKPDSFTVLRGNDLLEFRYFTETVSIHCTQLMLLFEPGLVMVCNRTGNPVGRRLKDFLFNKVLLKIEDPKEEKPEEIEVKSVADPSSSESNVSRLVDGMSAIFETKEEEKKISAIVSPREESYQIVEIEFYNGTIHALMDKDGNIWMSVRRACEHLEIDSNGQQQRLKDPDRSPWSNACIMHALDASGRNFSQFMLHIDSVPMWLATISLSRLNAETKELLKKYQIEAAKVLRDHFLRNGIQQFGGYEIPKSYPDALRKIADLYEEKGLAVQERDSAIEELVRDKPFSNYGKALISCNSNGISIGEFADFLKIVKTNGKFYNQNDIFETLRKLGFLIDEGRRYNKPYKKYRDNSMFDIEIKTGNDGYDREGIPIIYPRGEIAVVNEMFKYRKMLEIKEIEYRGEMVKEQLKFDFFDDYNEKKLSE